MEYQFVMMWNYSTILIDLWIPSKYNYKFEGINRTESSTTPARFTIAPLKIDKRYVRTSLRSLIAFVYLYKHRTPVYIVRAEGNIHFMICCTLFLGRFAEKCSVVQNGFSGIQKHISILLDIVRRIFYQPNIEWIKSVNFQNCVEYITSIT